MPDVGLAWSTVGHSWPTLGQNVSVLVMVCPRRAEFDQSWAVVCRIRLDGSKQVQIRCAQSSPDMAKYRRIGCALFRGGLPAVCVCVCRRTGLLVFHEIWAQWDGCVSLSSGCHVVSLLFVYSSGRPEKHHIARHIVRCQLSRRNEPEPRGAKPLFCVGARGVGGVVPFRPQPTPPCLVGEGGRPFRNTAFLGGEGGRRFRNTALTHEIAIGTSASAGDHHS